MSDPNEAPSGDSVPGMEYPSALAALEDRQIFAIVPVEGGFEIREKGRDEYFVRLLPEQLRELGEELIALAATAPAPAPEPEAPPTLPAEPTAPAAPGSRGHTITIPSSVWDARVTQEFRSRIEKLDQVESPARPPRRPDVKPWIKP